MALMAIPVSAYTPVDTLPKAQNAPITIDKLVHDSSIEYGVSEPLMRKIIQCESGGNPNAVGDHGMSYGLVQIYLPAHPNVTKEEAIDPAFAVDFLAKNLAQGNGRMWTCYRLVVQ